MKKIALSVVLASTFALAACGGGATNNTANGADTNQANTVAPETMNEANAMIANEMNGAANQMNGAAGQLRDAANQANGAAQDLANTAAGH